MQQSKPGRRSRLAEHALFLKQVIRNPRAMGSIAPSTRYLSRVIGRLAASSLEGPVLEIGAGTGSFTRAMINAGIDESQLYIVELNGGLCRHLQQQFPRAKVIRADAARLCSALPPEIVGRFLIVVSGLPLVNMPRPASQAIINEIKASMAPEGRFLQFTYLPFSPISVSQHAFRGQRIAWVLRNVPPATVWQYQNIDYPVDEVKKTA
jgi:phosphatidylethanolamine/phosphatidyl-N-methylethanolamine N-methyltransferase